MRTFLLFLFLLIAFLNTGLCQEIPDSVVRKGKDTSGVQVIVPPDSASQAGDTVRQVMIPVINQDSLQAVLARKRIDRIQSVLQGNWYFKFRNAPIKLTIEERKMVSDERIFYFLLALLLYFALIRIIFSKYLDNLMSLFFRVTMRQQQIREQVLQTPLPSLLLNILFVVSAGLYLTFIARYLNVVHSTGYWLLLGYSIAFISVLYTGKFLLLKFTGWIFNVSPATDTYIFIVFLVNKMIGMFLLPFLVIMAFPSSGLYQPAVTLSIVLIGILFLYRFLISYRPIRNEIKLGKFHFFLYLCAFEIAPLLLIYKVLLSFVERSA